MAEGEQSIETEAARGYQPMADYAAIGDCHGCALVARDGGIDWCTLDRFDAAPVFCRLLDAGKGGFLSARPIGYATATRHYLPGTNIPRTEFRGASGAVAVTDFMPVGRATAAGARCTGISTASPARRKTR